MACRGRNAPAADFIHGAGVCVMEDYSAESSGSGEGDGVGEQVLD